MNDQEYKKLKSRIGRLIKMWYKPAGFGWWRTEFVYSRERKPNDDNVAAETHADFAYSQATITFYLPAMRDMDDDDLEGVVVHELCHLTASSYPQFEDNADAHSKFERTVDDFARHLIWASKNVRRPRK